MTQQKDPNQSAMQIMKPFIFAGIAGCTATSFTMPIDSIKVRIQLASEAIAQGKGEGQSINPIKILTKSIKEEGPKGLYKGLDAALVRQVTYGTVRMGLYRYLSDVQQHKKNRNLYIYEKIITSSFAGIVGCMFGNPADVALVRMQGDKSLPIEQRRNYKNISDALIRIVKEEGILTYWRGSFPSIIRAIAMNVGMMTTYDEIKERLNSLTKHKNSLYIQLASSACSGVVCAFLSLPFDNAKTKMQRMKAGQDGKLPYNNVIDCIKKTIVNEGPTKLWVGFSTYVMRVSPHAMISLLVQEFCAHQFNKKPTTQ
ncbi:mitochondrial carrier protein, putative [Ichthyophthirius multifiliis]|uniref:Mitochondrial carrier protein, putative n=1 Tax=Ichthyophthirius multifiliis TaxID=5932 RepID=G0R2W6_ICHMU|nr:mitochondrial carrier protein, putative [Ichthyophthirius multifiliis]EGR28177.1 mitochondrial carrier protein, putative [Ichthyophthirius multifiliis]|eukprot:XP_004027522.1 mitochondrial carrier protein, putative [Ichthyophthirius multifiliis]